MKHMYTILVIGALLAVCTPRPALAQTQEGNPIPSGFVYQGVLTLGGQPVAEPFMASFILYPTPDGPDAPVASEIQRLVTPDDRGRFSVELNFGLVFDQAPRYLQITLLDDSGDPTPLLPRTKVTATPFATYALEARIPALAEVTQGRADSVEGGFHEIEASADFTRGIRLQSDPVSTIFAVPGIRAVDDFNIETTAGELGLTMGSSTMTLGQGGIDLQGLVVDIDSDTSITIDAALSARVEGLVTTIRGDAQLQLQGGVILMDGQTIINGHQLTDNLAQITGNLQVTGNAFKPGGGPWAALSDAREKKNISPLHGSLDTVRALRPVRFEYNNPGHPLYAPGVQHGFIAQEVRAVRPDWITADEEGTLMLTPRGFEAMMVDAIQELESAHRQQLETLQAENDQLRARLDRLEALLRSSETGH
ncbi:MAG: tail fiber domain-containing protein [Phycisphaerales bacterium]